MCEGQILNAIESEKSALYKKIANRCSGALYKKDANRKLLARTDNMKESSHRGCRRMEDSAGWVD